MNRVRHGLSKCIRRPLLVDRRNAIKEMSFGNKMVKLVNHACVLRKVGGRRGCLVTGLPFEGL